MNVLLHGVDQFTAGVAVNGAELAVKGFELNLCSEVIAVFIQQHTYRRWRQEAVQLQLFRRLRFNHIHQLNQQRSDR